MELSPARTTQEHRATAPPTRPVVFPQRPVEAHMKGRCNDLNVSRSLCSQLSQAEIRSTSVPHKDPACL